MIEIGFAVAGAATCSVICVAAGVVRWKLSEETRRRVGQLEKAAELLDFHARNLALFLDDPRSPVELKRTALRFADFMADRRAVFEFATWLSRQPLDGPQSDGESLELTELVRDLRQRYPELESAFSSAVLCGAFGAMLRFPETADLWVSGGPTLIADGRREVVAAVQASRMKERSPIEVCAPDPVMA